MKGCRSSQGRSQRDLFSTGCCDACGVEQVVGSCCQGNICIGAQFQSSRSASGSNCPTQSRTIRHFDSVGTSSQDHVSHLQCRDVDSVISRTTKHIDQPRLRSFSRQGDRISVSIPQFEGLDIANVGEHIVHHGHGTGNARNIQCVDTCTAIDGVITIQRERRRATRGKQ